ncbi:MAG: 50S ribosomal protein L20 [Candidatus Berkelbacteria bacterium]|nr:50S ribosomal protein L20 [Candidatus Berkelbacteria bacterium]
MARVKRGKTSRARHKSLIQKAKGFRHGRKNVYRQAKQAVEKAKAHTYKSKKVKKRNFRSLWIVRLNAALKTRGIKYSKFIEALRKSNANLNRKELSQIALNNPAQFEKLIIKIGLKSPSLRTEHKQSIQDQK